MGYAANASARMSSGSERLEGDAYAIAASERALPGDAPYTAAASRDLARASLRLVDQVTATHAIIASAYVEYAARVLIALRDGEEIPPPGRGAPMPSPSSIAASPDERLPSVQIPGSLVWDVRRRSVNSELTDARDAVLSVIAQHVDAVIAVDYDDQAAAARRGPESHDLSPEYPRALHRYGAAIVAAIGLLAESVGSG